MFTDFNLISSACRHASVWRRNRISCSQSPRPSRVCSQPPSAPCLPSPLQELSCGICQHIPRQIFIWPSWQHHWPGGHWSSRSRFVGHIGWSRYWRLLCCNQDYAAHTLQMKTHMWMLMLDQSPGDTSDLIWDTGFYPLIPLAEIPSDSICVCYNSRGSERTTASRCREPDQSIMSGVFNSL